jgi:hypothetical protein
MANRIQLRRDLAANWTSVNPILAHGEMGLELDTYSTKVGDLNYNFLIIGGNTSISTTEISGSALSYFADISSTKTVAHTISLTGTITAQTWSINGTLGNRLTLKSGTSGIPAELYSQNSIDLNYTSIYDISALAVPTTTAIFTALLSNGNINGGGNTGWIFGSGGGNTSKFFLMF